MDKDQKDSKEEKKQEERTSEEVIKEQGGFPEDVDFKKFLGCGG